MGKLFEEKAKEDIYKLLGRNMVVDIVNTNYETHPDIERAGIDLVVILANGENVNVQVKSRKPDKTDFCFEVYKTRKTWALKPTKAQWIIFYLSKYSKEPYCIWYPVIQKMWLDYYDELVTNIKENNQKDGYCVYVSPTWFFEKHRKISKGKTALSLTIPRNICSK